MKIALALLACLGLCSCAFVPSDEPFDLDYVAPIVGHQQYATPVPAGSDFQKLSWGIADHYIGGGSASPIPKMFAPPQPPYSY